MILRVVKVHCGSGYVRGSARKWRYYVASLFFSRKTKDDRLIWYNSGEVTHPRRSLVLAQEDGRKLARTYDAMYEPGYGSLHNQSIC